MELIKFRDHIFKLMKKKGGGGEQFPGAKLKTIYRRPPFTENVYGKMK